MTPDYDDVVKEIFMHRLSELEHETISPDHDEMISSPISVEYFILSLILSPLRKVEGISIHLNERPLTFIDTGIGSNEATHLYDQLIPHGSLFVCQVDRSPILVGRLSEDLSTFYFYHH